MLLIITPTKFFKKLLPLKTHKEHTGITTKIIRLEDIYKDYRQGDEAERVKRCVADFHKKHSCKYLLVVGDSDTFPVRYTMTDRKSENACNTAFYPTDLYYAALYKQDGSFDRWDQNNNGYYGELRGQSGTGKINVDDVNLEPTIAVGRIPASTDKEVTVYVDKIIRYEQGAYGSSWPKHALMMATHDWQKDACKIQDRIARNFLNGYECTQLSSKGSPCMGAGNLTPTAITAELNRGAGIVGYIGHGGPDRLAMPDGDWGTSNIGQLYNDDRLPVMAVAACNTAEFATLPPYSAYVDVNNVKHIGTNKGEKFTSPPPQPACLQTLTDPDNDLATNLTVRTTAGVVAYLGGITGIQMYEPFEYFVQGLSRCTTVGEAWQLMVRKFYEETGLPGIITDHDWFDVASVHQPWKYMLFGDPSLRISGVKIGPERFNAIWMKTSEDRPSVWSWKRGDFDRINSKYYKKGFQLAELNAFVLPDQQGERFNAIWLKTAEHRPAVWGWSRKDFDKKQVELQQEGYRLKKINAFVLPDGQGERFNAIWVKTDDDRPAVWGWSRKDFDERAADYQKNGYQLAELNAFVLPGGEGERFNAIWEKTESDRPAVWGWLRKDFDKREAENRKKGYQLAELNAFVLPGGKGERFNAIWTRSKAGKQAVWGWARGDFDRKQDKLQDQGYRLHSIDCFVLE